MHLNRWHRLGIIASVVWIFASGWWDIGYSMLIIGVGGVILGWLGAYGILALMRWAARG